MTTVMEQRVLALPLDRVKPDPEQPRRNFDAADLQQLADSITHHGLLQAITVRVNPDKPGFYIIIAGERRWRAHCLNGTATIDAVVKSPPPESIKALQVVENAIRADLNPVEEARAYQQMLVDNDEDWDAVSLAASKPVNQIYCLVQMLEAEPKVLNLVETGAMRPMTAYHISFLTRDGQNRVLREMTSKELNHRQAVYLCDHVQAQESQTEMFPETKVNEQSTKAYNAFDKSLDRMIAFIGKFVELYEQSNPDDWHVHVRTHGPTIKEKTRLAKIQLADFERVLERAMVLADFETGKKKK